MEQTNRDFQLDNIKGLMLFCVVFTHAISNLYKGWSDDLITKYLYYFIYSFHMPVLIFISGYLSKRKTDYDTYIVKAVKNCLVPYVVFNVLYGLPSVKSALNIMMPKWTLWYLLSLFWWKLLSETVTKIKWSVPVALLLSLYIGLIPVGSYLSISRTIGFFPFFLAGYQCKEETIGRLRKIKKVFPIMAFIFALIAAGFLSNMEIKAATLFFRDSYETLGQTYLQGVVLRIVLMLNAFMCIVGLISTIPTRKTVISNIGMYSITVYLGHSVIIRALKYFGIVNISNPFLFIVFAFCFSLVLCFALGNRSVSHIYQRVFGIISSFVIKA